MTTSIPELHTVGFCRYNEEILMNQSDVILLENSDSWQEQFLYLNGVGPVTIPGSSIVWIRRADVMRGLYYSKHPDAKALRDRFIEHDKCFRNEKSSAVSTVQPVAPVNTTTTSTTRPSVVRTIFPVVASQFDFGRTIAPAKSVEQQLVDDITRLTDELDLAKARLLIHRAEQKIKSNK